MIWTRERPTAPGWYWYRGKGLGLHVEVRPLLVQMRDWEVLEGNDEDPLWADFPETPTYPSLSALDGEWAGPIPQPSEPAASGPAHSPVVSKHWPPDDPDTFEGHCGLCCEERPLQWVADPFACEGISDESPDVRHAWCRPCLELRQDDV